VQETILPEGLDLNLRLTTFLDTDRAQVGDPLEAVLLKDAKMHGTVVVPKKARIRGRISLLDRKKGYVIVGLEWSELEFGSTKAPVAAKLVEIISQLPGTGRTEMPLRSSPIAYDADTAVVVAGVIGATNPILENTTPGVGTFFVKSSRLKYRNLEMIWRTLPPK
jgi:hypothetical protein